MSPHSVYGAGLDMAEPTSPTAPGPGASSEDAPRERWFRIVLLGLVVLVLGFTATLMANFFYPCVPAAGPDVQPPLADCAVFLSPWLGILAAGLVLAGIGYLRVR